MNEEERKQKVEEIAIRMYTAGLGWNYDAIERLTRPEIRSIRAIQDMMRMPEPTPFERGVLDRYQPSHRRKHKNMRVKVR